MGLEKEQLRIGLEPPLRVPYSEILAEQRERRWIHILRASDPPPLSLRASRLEAEDLFDHLVEVSNAFAHEA